MKSRQTAERQNFFFRKNLFSKKKKMELPNQYLILTSFIEGTNKMYKEVCKIVPWAVVKVRSKSAKVEVF
jgi:hypothetical protein